MFSLFAVRRGFDFEERQRIFNAEASMNTALVFVAQKYKNIIVGDCAREFHHFYWIEGKESDPLTKRRGILPYTRVASRTILDRGNYEVKKAENTKS